MGKIIDTKQMPKPSDFHERVRKEIFALHIHFLSENHFELQASTENECGFLTQVIGLEELKSFLEGMTMAMEFDFVRRYETVFDEKAWNKAISEWAQSLEDKK
jgi:hypothetical protein